MNELHEVVRTLAGRHIQTQWTRLGSGAADRPPVHWRGNAKPHIHGFTTVTPRVLADVIAAAGVGVHYRRGEYAVDGVVTSNKNAIKTLRERAANAINYDTLPADVSYLGHGLVESIARLQADERYAGAVLRRLGAGEVEWPVKQEATEAHRQQRLMLKTAQQWERLVTELAVEMTDVPVMSSEDVNELALDLAINEGHGIIRNNGDRSGARLVVAVMTAGGSKRKRVRNGGERVTVYESPECVDESAMSDELIARTVKYVSARRHLDQRQLVEYANNRRSA